MKIALAQLNYHIGNFRYNVAQIINAIAKAKSGGADLIIFAELSVCGYPPRDFLEFDDFTNQCEEAVVLIAEKCREIAAIVGAPSRNPAIMGKPLYNTAWFLAEGKILSKVHKTLLPNYDVFDEYRYFQPNRLPYSTVNYKGVRLAVTICEDLWNITDEPQYIRNPMDELNKLNPDIIINIAASPFNYNQAATRRDVLARNASNYGLPLVYVNQAGGQTELIFDGDSMVMDREGKIIAGLKSFKEDFMIVEVGTTNEESRKTNLQSAPKPSVIRSPSNLHTFKSSNSTGVITLIHDALLLGIRDYFVKMGFKKAILGLSGGIDSAVTLALAAEALGNENVRAVLLPSQFSSDHSITDARQLADNLGVIYDIIPIEGSFHAVGDALKPTFQQLPFDLTEENIQARIRAVILMAMSNKFGYILLNTSNKSEAAVGYGTLYGDMCGGLSVLGDVYKTQVYALARYINREREVIPENTINKPPSAELRHDQKDSDSLPEYDILDHILFHFIEQRMGPEELVTNGFDASVVRRVVKLVNTSEFKRHQAPPILRVSPKAFGMGRRMPIVAKYLS